MDRLRAVLERRPATEAELRKLTEEGRAWALLVNAQLEKSKERLDELARDPDTPITELAGALRQVHELAPELDEVHALLSELQNRAREFRQTWVSR
jgi:uncharacterized coiled-coil DUF342 family protein